MATKRYPLIALAYKATLAESYYDNVEEEKGLERIKRILVHLRSGALMRLM